MQIADVNRSSYAQSVSQELQANVHEDPFLSEMRKKARQLRDSKFFPPHLTEPPFSLILFKKTEPINALIQCLPREEQKKYDYELLGKLKDDAAPFGKVEELGKNLWAHGVSKENAGILSLLNIMLEGSIIGWEDPQGWSGGPPYYGKLAGEIGWEEYYSGSHGPYFIFIDDEDGSMERCSTNPRFDFSYMIEERFHLAYLVPEEENRQIILFTLAKAVELGMLTEVEADRLRGKLLTYAEFLQLPREALTDISHFKQAMIDRVSNSR